MANTYDSRAIHGKELLDFGTEIAKKIRTDDEVIAASLNNLNSRLEAFENIENWGDILADSINTSEFPLVAGKPMVVVKAGSPSGTTTIPDYAGQFYVDSTNKVIYCSGGYSSVNDWVDVTNKIGTGTVGSATKPIYLNSGTPTAGSDYAGGTKVTLNGTDKGASTATIYAPTTAGTNNYVLKSNGSGEPSWVEKAPKASAADTATTATDYNTSTGTIKSGLDSKVNVANIDLTDQTTTLLAQVRAMVTAGTHYARFYTRTDGGSANISDKPESGSKGFLCEVLCNRYLNTSDYRYHLQCWVGLDKNPYTAVVSQETTTLSWSKLNQTLSHTHGNITNAGAIGSTSGNAVYTTTNGVLTAGSLATNDPTADGTTITAIDTLSQDAKGKVTATKKTIRSATTSQTGVVQLNDNINSTSTTEAATANAVKKAYDKANGKQDPITFDGTYNASSNKAATVSTVTTAVSNAVNGLDATVTSSDGTNVQVKVTETDGKITAVNVTTDNTANKTHAHGNIQSGGTLQTNDVSIASGDKLVITDSSDSNKVARASISFDGSTTTKALTQKGTFEAFAKASDITSAIQALDVSSVGGAGKYISAISETDGKISATATTMDTSPTASSTNAVTSGGIKSALDLKAPLASPALTGTPTAPTASAGTNTTQIATTAFVTDAASNCIKKYELFYLSDWTFSPSRFKIPPLSQLSEGFYCLRKRGYVITATLTNGSTTTTWGNDVIDYMFDGTYEHYTPMFGDGYTLTINIAPPSGQASLNIGYGVTGYIVVGFYHVYAPTSVACRIHAASSASATKTWIDISPIVVPGTGNDIQCWIFGNSYYFNDQLEITIVGKTQSSSVKTSVPVLQFITSRPTANSYPYVRKYSPETLYNSLTAPKFIGALQGNADTATKLATTRELAVNLANTSTTSNFDGSASQTGIKVSGTLQVANGGTGLTASPSMLTNLGSTSAANVFAASPRPGVTGTLPIANGGTGLTASPSMLTNLGSTTAANVLTASPRPGVTGTLPITNGGTGATTAANARSNLSVYSKSEVDSMLTGRISIVTSLPATGEAGVIYFVGPTGSGSDKYEEYVWDGSAFVKVGEKSLDLSNYVNTLTTTGSGNAITAISKSGNTITATIGNVTFTQPQLGQGYGTCGTAEATAAKTVTLSDFVLKNGGIVAVKFTYALCASATLNVNSTGAKPVLIAGAAPTSSTCKAVQANDIAYFIYDGTSYHFLGTERASRSSITNITRSGTTFTATRADGSTFTFTQQDNNTTYTQETLGQGYGTCTTAEATAAKTVSLTNYELVTNGIIAVKFSYGLCASATLNVNSKGAKPIYIQGAAVSSTTAKEVLAGDIALFMYDGTQYQFLCSDRLSKDAITGLSASGRTITYTKADGTTGTLTTQDTTYTFDGTYNASTNKAATVSTVTNKIAALDVNDISGFGAGKTLATLTETDGKIAATFQNISITKSQVSDFPTSMTPTSHASSATTYGIGTASNYGHVKLATGDMNGAAHADGVAVSKNHTHSQYQTVLTEMTTTEVSDLVAAFAS